MNSRLLVFSILTFMAITRVAGAEKLNERWTVTFGERIRLESWDNAISLDGASGGAKTYTRNRTQLGTVWSPLPELSFGARLGNEFRYYLTPANVDFNFGELFIDQLYIKAVLPWYRPMTATIGRQDIMLGEGFVMMDGGPLDGSRSGYFNAVRFDWAVSPIHQLTAFVCRQEEKDDWLPIIHEQNQAMTEQPENGMGIYYGGKWTEREAQGYFIHRRLDDNAAYPLSSIISTIGGRIKQKIPGGTNLTGVLEAGYQFGKRGDADRGAFGGYGYFLYVPTWKTPRPYLPTILGAGFIYLSGDNRNTEKWEGWDPMYGRWPKWSDSYIYTLIKENCVAWWTNLVSLNAETRFQLSASLELKVQFHHLTAPQNSEVTPAFPGGTGTRRGELLISKMSYKFDQRWSGHLLYEFFDPGDYYFDGADDFVWFRAELMYLY